MTAPPLTAADMGDMLRGHYLPPSRPASGLYASEVGSPCGRRRADALWLPLTRAGGTGLVGHEIKVTRSDVLAELADPTKAEPWSQYCSKWWLVVSDPALVDGLDIPDAWGIMTPPSGRRTRSMTIIRRAPDLTPLEPALGLRRLLGWYFYSTQSTIDEQRRDLEYRQREVERARAAAAEARVMGGPTSSPHAQRVARIIHAAEQRLNEERLWAQVRDEEVVDALVDACATRQAARNVRDSITRHVSAVESALDPLKYVKHDLEAAIKLGAKELDPAAGVK